LLGEKADHPIFEGGMNEPDEALKIKEASVEIMSSTIRKRTFAKLGIENLQRKWEYCRIIEKNEDDSYKLTGNGSWLADQLIQEVNDLINE
jgi:hypothetical protein